jgi:TFIIF-interacting CTD phosphatase-like protein
MLLDDADTNVTLVSHMVPPFVLPTDPHYETPENEFDFCDEFFFGNKCMLCNASAPIFRRRCDSCLQKKLFILLDLDETLVHADMDHKVPQTACRQDGQPLTLDAFSIGEGYLLHKRPHCDFFLRQLFKKYIVAFWSAGTASYVHSIVQHLVQDPGEVPECILTRDDLPPFTSAETTNKPLHAIAPFIGNMIHVDDKPCNFRMNPAQGYQIARFDSPATQTTDTELLKLLSLLQVLEQVWEQRQSTHVPQALVNIAYKEDAKDKVTIAMDVAFTTDKSAPAQQMTKKAFSLSNS